MVSNFIDDHESTLWLLGIVSLITFVGSLVIMPWLIVRIPADYFAKEQRQVVTWGKSHPFIRFGLRISKNCLGGILVLAGLAMLVLPGQGILTILIGIVLLDFPRKYEFERWLIRRKPVLATVTALRKRAGRKALRFDQSPLN